MGRQSMFNQLVGVSPEIANLRNVGGLIAGTDCSVLILGETGTGKEIVARGLHEASGRREAPFIAVNASMLGGELTDSLLFGHRKGAFSGAIGDHAGLIQAAAGGTLFLDEIGDMPLSAQAHLLRFLDSGEVLRVGDTHPEQVDVRIVAATHRALDEAIGAGRFRADLYHRLMVVPLVLPPLRERGGDLRLLTQHFLDATADRYSRRVPRCSRAALRVLEQHAWPGNVRELQHFCERLVLLSGPHEVSADLVRAMLGPVPAATSARADPRAVFGLESVRRDPVRAELPEDGLDWDVWERSLLGQALQRAGGNRSRAARLLGLTRDQLVYRLKKHGLQSTIHPADGACT